MDEQALMRRWEVRQAGLNEALASHEPKRLEFRLDLDTREIFWVTPDGTPRLRAGVKVLCTHVPRDSTVVMSWADDSLDPEVTVGPYGDVPDEVHPCAEPDAWLQAMVVGELAGAQHLYRIPGPDQTLYLGLWDLSPVREGETFVRAPAAPDVLRVLDGLAQAVWLRRGRGSAMGSHLREEGEAMIVQSRFVHQGQEAEVLLLRTGEALVRLADSVDVPAGPLPAAEVRRLGTALADLRRAWES